MAVAAIQASATAIGRPLRCALLIASAQSKDKGSDECSTTYLFKCDSRCCRRRRSPTCLNRTSEYFCLRLKTDYKNVAEKVRLVKFGFVGSTLNSCETSSGRLRLPLSQRQPLSWLDDDYRIKMSLSVIFGGGVRRIVEPYAVYQELVSILAGRQINSTHPPVNFFRAVVPGLDPVVERSIDSYSLGVDMARQLKGCIAGDTGHRRRHLLNPNNSRLTI